MIDLPPLEIRCIAETVWLEARNQSQLGQKAIAHVVLNRSKKLKMSPCRVVHQPGQFSIKFRKTYSGAAWKKAWRIAHNPGRDPTAGALYFKTKGSPVSWNFRLTTAIGHHVFFK